MIFYFTIFSIYLFQKFEFIYMYIFFQLRIQREVDFHDNIIRCHGITKFESGNFKICHD
jgi:hypothetical protein